MRKIMLFGIAWLILSMAHSAQAAGKSLFYNASTGKGATARLDGAGNYSFVGAISGFAPGWTHITGL